MRRIYTSIERCEELNAISCGLGKNIVNFIYSYIHLLYYCILFFVGKLLVDEAKATHIMELESDDVRKRMATHTFEVKK